MIAIPTLAGWPRRRARPEEGGAAIGVLLLRTSCCYSR
jgi:hypothetical protein